MSDVHLPAKRLRRPSWRDSRLLVGVLIVLASVLVGARVVAAADHSVLVYAAQESLSSGHSLQAEDLRVVRVRLGAGTAGYLSAGTVPPEGMVLIRPVGAGELVPTAALAPASRLERRPVAVPVSAPLPQGLSPGATVDLWSSAKEPGAGATGYRAPVRIARGAEIYAVSAPGAGLAAIDSGSVQVLLAETELRAVLDALANGARVAVVPAPGSVPDDATSASPTGPVEPNGSAGPSRSGGPTRPGRSVAPSGATGSARARG